VPTPHRAGAQNPSPTGGLITLAAITYRDAQRRNVFCHRNLGIASAKQRTRRLKGINLHALSRSSGQTGCAGRRAGGSTGFCRTLSAEEWVTPSGCAGWTVKDVVAHMGGGYHGPFQPSWIRRVATASEAEQQAEHDVSARRSWPSTAVVAEFDVWGSPPC
jgi:hypothetical protein